MGGTMKWEELCNGRTYEMGGTMKCKTVKEKDL